MKHDKLTCFCFTAAAVFFSLPTAALPEDSDQPIQVEANTAERDDKTGQIIYTGDVLITQGTIVIRGEKVVLQTRNDEFTSLTATGGPAHYEQVTEAGKGPVVAEAGTIRFLHDKDLVILEQNATLKQDGSQIKGNRIEYNMKDKKVKAGSPATGKKRSAGDRISVVIPPSKKKTQDKENR